MTKAIAPDIIGAKTKTKAAPRGLSAPQTDEFPSLTYVVAKQPNGPAIPDLGPFGYFCDACTAAHRAYTGPALYVVALPTGAYPRRIARIITRGYRS